jgi:hypothetical protein
MKKYIVSILVASVFLIGVPFLAPKASASDLSIRDFINLLVAIGVITPDKMPAINAFLVAQNSTPISTPSVSNPVSCAMDAMRCSDGSYVGRSGLNCEFKCPVVTPIIATPSINILSPDGGETYKNDGSPITVNWQTKNVPSSFKFDVVRLRGYPNGGETILATNVRNDGQEVVVPVNVPDGAYTLEIKAYLNDVLVMDSSDSYFKIVSVTPESQLITDSIKCVFKNNDFNLTQSCYAQNRDGKQYNFSGIDTVVGEVTGYQDEKITWKSSCGEYEYTVIDGDNDYAYFNCSSVQPAINILSPDGGETYKKESLVTVNWETDNIDSNQVFDVIRFRDYDNGGEYNLAYNVINDGQEIIKIQNVPVGAYTLEIKGSINGQSIKGESDSYFKVVSDVGDFWYGTTQSDKGIPSERHFYKISFK